MRMPRDTSGRELANALAKLGYEVTRQTGSHMRLTARGESTHHVTIPAHTPLRVGTLNAILRDVAAHRGLSRDELLRTLFS